MIPESDVEEVEPENRLKPSAGGRPSDLGHLAAVVAHDFNNVLSIVQGSATLLRRLPGLTPTQVRELDDLDGAVRHGAELVRQMFTYGRRDPAMPGRVDLNKVITEMDWMLRRLGRRSIAVDFVLARDLGCVNIEEIQVEQVLLNLALNARDAMPEGGRLVIETDNVSEDTVRLSVSDDGHGISEEVQARLFKPFFTTKSDGTGLGLFSVRRIVDQCGGRIRVYSVPGEGTTFEIYFPRAKGPP